MITINQRPRMPSKKHELSSDEIRKRMGLPQDANRWVSLLVYPALVPMLALRRKLGVRMVSLSRLVGICAVMLLWGLLVGGVFALVSGWRTSPPPTPTEMFQNAVAEKTNSSMASITDWMNRMKATITSSDPPPPPPVPEATTHTWGHFFDAVSASFGDSLDPLLDFGLVILALGVAHRLIRWVSRQAGEQLNTKSLGISLIPLPIKNQSIERYLDPLLCAAAGVAVIGQSSDQSLLGYWLLFCALSLGIVEKYVHEIQLDQYDALLNAEAHEQITAAYLSGMQRSAGRNKVAKPVATGMSPDVKTRQVERVRRELQGLPSTAKVDLLSGASMPAASEPAAIAAPK